MVAITQVRLSNKLQEVEKTSTEARGKMKEDYNNLQIDMNNLIQTINTNGWISPSYSVIKHKYNDTISCK